MGATKRILLELAFEIALYFAGMAAISMLFHYSTALLLLFAVLGAAVVWMWHEKDDICFFVAGAFMGPAGEAICISFGAWQYAAPDFLGIPVWLPLAWGFVALLIKRIAGTAAKMRG